jgi:hypothetical protein
VRDPDVSPGLPARSPGLLRLLEQRNQTMLGVYAKVASLGTIRIGDMVTVERC